MDLTIANEYLKKIKLSEDLFKLYKINPESILEEYIANYLDFKKIQETKSSSEAIPVKETKISNIINFSDLECFDKWIMTPKYKIYLANIISKLRTIGSILGKDRIQSLRSPSLNSYFDSSNIYQFDFFTKYSVQPNFLTFQRILYTFGFGYQIFSWEFKKFFTCGHRMIGLIGSDGCVTITLNVDTSNEFFKRLSKLEHECVGMGIKNLFDEFKVLFGKFKNYVIGLIVSSAINNLNACGYKISLCLQECDEDLYLYLKNKLGNIFIGFNFSPQKYKTYKINNFIDFAFDPKSEKIKLEPSNTIHGFATFTNHTSKLTPVKVFNSLVLSHEKNSLERRFVYTNRGIYIPELNLYNLHLKSNYACGNLVSLEKYYFENEFDEYESIFVLDYDFTSKQYTQMYGVVALANKFQFLTTQEIHHIIDVIYERRVPFDQVLLKLQYYTHPEVNIFTNIKSELKEKYLSLFEEINWDKFIQAVAIHWTKSFEKDICKVLMSHAVQEPNLAYEINPDIVIKEFCSKSELIPTSTLISKPDKPNLVNLVICGDINIILKDINGIRIKKYSLKSKSTEDEPFGHLVKMQMNSWGNDVIFSL